MIRIAILDDDKNEIENAIGFLNNYAKAHEELNFYLQSFSDANSLIKYLNKNLPFDIYLFDIVLKDNELGTDLARTLRAKKLGGEIIFVTTSRDYAIDAFNINATHYLLKPFSKVSFDAAIDRAIENIHHKDEELVISGTSSGVQKIFINHICYTESNGHYQNIVLKNGEIVKVRKKTQELWEDLKVFKQFFRPHTGYIVNMDHVKGVSSDSLVVENGGIPISKNSYRKVKQEYLDYVFGKGAREE